MTADATGRPVTVRPLARADLARLSGWLAEPHVARWWRDPNDLAAVTATYQPCIDGTDPTEVFVIEAGPARGLHPALPDRRRPGLGPRRAGHRRRHRMLSRHRLPHRRARAVRPRLRDRAHQRVRRDGRGYREALPSVFIPPVVLGPPSAERDDERLAAGLVSRRNAPGRPAGSGGSGWADPPTSDLTTRRAAGSGQPGAGWPSQPPDRTAPGRESRRRGWLAAGPGPPPLGAQADPEDRRGRRPAGRRRVRRVLLLPRTPS